MHCSPGLATGPRCTLNSEVSGHQSDNAVYRGRDEAQGSLRSTETPEELREKLTHQVQDTRKTIEYFAREIRDLASSAFKGLETAILENIMIKQFVDGLGNANTR